MLAPVLVMLVTLLAYVFINGQDALTAEKAFVSLALFNSMILFNALECS